MYPNHKKQAITGNVSTVCYHLLPLMMKHIPQTNVCESFSVIEPMVVLVLHIHVKAIRIVFLNSVR